MIIIYVASEDENEEPIEFVRILDIPVAQSVKARLTGPTNVKKSTSSTAKQPSTTISGGPSIK